MTPSRSLDVDLARLLLRVSVGGTMIAHGVKHARSLPGTARWFESIGFRNPRLQARLSAGVEIGAGAALIAGAATPLSASAVVGTMAVAARSVHIPNGFFVTAEGWEYVAALGVSSVAIGALGGGRFSVDRALGLDHRLCGSRGAATALGIGLAGAAVQLAAFWHSPKPSREDDVAHLR
jgi:putative oxidoreductase